MSGQSAEPKLEIMGLTRNESIKGFTASYNSDSAHRFNDAKKHLQSFKSKIMAGAAIWAVHLAKQIVKDQQAGTLKTPLITKDAITDYIRVNQSLLYRDKPMPAFLEDAVLQNLFRDGKIYTPLLIFAEELAKNPKTEMQPPEFIGALLVERTREKIVNAIPPPVRPKYTPAGVGWARDTTYPRAELHYQDSEYTMGYYSEVAATAAAFWVMRLAIQMRKDKQPDLNVTQIKARYFGQNSSKLFTLNMRKEHISCPPEYEDKVLALVNNPTIWNYVKAFAVDPKRAGERPLFPNEVRIGEIVAGKLPMPASVDAAATSSSAAAPPPPPPPPRPPTPPPPPAVLQEAAPAAPVELPKQHLLPAFSSDYHQSPTFPAAATDDEMDNMSEESDTPPSSHVSAELMELLGGDHRLDLPPPPAAAPPPPAAKRGFAGDTPTYKRGRLTQVRKFEDIKIQKAVGSVGIYKIVDSDNWCAEVKYKDTIHNLGSFTTEIRAKAAQDYAKIHLAHLAIDSENFELVPLQLELYDPARAKHSIPRTIAALVEKICGIAPASEADAPDSPDPAPGSRKRTR